MGPLGGTVFSSDIVGGGGEGDVANRLALMFVGVLGEEFECILPVAGEYDGI